MDASFVGRTGERGELEDAVAAARDGSGAVVVVSGAPGIGKTTVLTALAASAAGSGVRVLRGRCLLDPGTPALWPWRSVLDQGRDLGLDPASLDAASGPPQQARFLSLLSTATDLIRAAGRGPLLILVDDLQWADEPSLRLLAHLQRDVAGTRLLVVGATRETATLSTVVGDAAVHWIGLDGWTVAEVGIYLRQGVGSFHRSCPRSCTTSRAATRCSPANSCAACGGARGLTIRRRTSRCRRRCGRCCATV